MLGSARDILHSLGLLAPVALLASLKVIILALRALPATIGELKIIGPKLLLINLVNQTFRAGASLFLTL